MTDAATLDAILRSVIDEPDEDVHRYAYADLCEENGDQRRADFIRSQLTPHGLKHRHRPGDGPCAACKGAVRLTTKDARSWFWPFGPSKLVTAHTAKRREWLIMEEWGMNRSPRVTVRRGFLEGFYGLWTAWFAYGPTMVLKHPVRKVELPQFHPGYSDETHWWSSPEQQTLPGYATDYFVPPVLFDRLPDPDFDGGAAKGYKTLASALNALSDAAILYAKDVAKGPSV